MDDRPMFLLGPIAAFLRWLEELANLLSGPLLVAGLGVALIDLLTDGALLTAAPVLLYGWAISQAVGVDAQLVGAWDRAKRAVLQRRWWSLLGLIALGCVLAYVGYVAAMVFAMQQAYGLTTAAALTRLHMDATTWLWQRVGVSVFLVCLSGWTRYRAPSVKATAADERQRLERELELEPLRQQLRQTRLAGVRDAATALVGNPGRAAIIAPDPPDAAQDDEQTALTPDDDATDVQPSDEPPAPSEPVAEPPLDEPPVPPEPSAPVPFRKRRPHQAASGRKPVTLRAVADRSRAQAQEQQAFTVLDEHPKLSIADLRTILARSGGCSRARAAQLKHAWLLEHIRRQQSQQA